eukprot:649213-Pelagomonas_calceolata.AAC.3
MLPKSLALNKKARRLDARAHGNCCSTIHGCSCAWQLLQPHSWMLVRVATAAAPFMDILRVATAAAPFMDARARGNCCSLIHGCSAHGNCCSTILMDARARGNCCSTIHGCSAQAPAAPVPAQTLLLWVATIVACAAALVPVKALPCLLVRNMSRSQAQAHAPAAPAPASAGLLLAGPGPPTTTPAHTER